MIIETYTPASTGVKLHRCNLCWPEAHPADNGFVPATQPIPHAQNCPARPERNDVKPPAESLDDPMGYDPAVECGEGLR